MEQWKSHEAELLLMKMPYRFTHQIFVVQLSETEVTAHLQLTDPLLFWPSTY